MSLVYIHAVLPTLDFEFKPDVHSDEMLDLLKFNFSSSHLRMINKLRTFYDIQNLLVQWSLEGDDDDRANYKGKKILEMCEDQEEIENVIKDYLERYDADIDRELNVQELYLKYYFDGIKKSSGFLKKIFQFEYDLYQINAAYRAKKLNVDCEKVFNKSQLGTDNINFLIANQSAQEFVFPWNYKELETLLANGKSSPMGQFMAQAQFRFEFYKKEIEKKPLTLSGILAYLMSLWILEDIHNLDQEKGMLVVNAIVENEYE